MKATNGFLSLNKLDLKITRNAIFASYQMFSLFHREVVGNTDDSLLLQLDTISLYMEDLSGLSESSRITTTVAETSCTHHDATHLNMLNLDVNMNLCYLTGI